MKTTKYFLFTCKNNLRKSNDKIYNLMIKGGLIRKLSSGIYIWLPNGLKIINNINEIIKKYMNNIGGIEIYLPILQDSYIWFKSNRYNLYGKELFKLNDRNKKKFILSPTNEEIITSIFCNELNFNNNYNKIFYQIQTKFRDEIRPRYSLLRTKEFIMKEAYSFHKSLDSLNDFYFSMLDLYKNIFCYLGLNFYYKKASCGNIGGNLSHEFHIKSLYGDNKIYLGKEIFNNYKFLNNLDNGSFKLFYVFKYLNNFNFRNKVYKKKFVKTLLVKLYKKNSYSSLLFILIPIKKKIDINKLYKIFPFVTKIKFFSKKKIYKKFGIYNIFFCPFGYYYQIIADYSLINYKNFILGSNINGYFYINVNFFKNINVSNFYNICKNSIIYISNKNKINKIKSIEIAHTFKLMDYYSNIFINKNNLKNKIYMCCYGIGITRLVYSIIEYYKFNNNIVLPLCISHFKLGIIPIDMYKFSNVFFWSFKIYKFLYNKNINIIIDNRKLHFGEMLTDFEVIGIPNILIISNRMLSIGLFEFRDRLNNIIKYISKDYIFYYLLNKYI